MRRPRSRSQVVVAALGGVMLVMVMGPWTEVKARQLVPRGRETPAPGQAPPQAPGGQAEPAQDGRQTRAAQPELVPVDTEPLARYVPAEPFGFYFEFPGLNTVPDAWHQTAAFGMLNETTLGEMLRELLAQAVEKADAETMGQMTGEEVAMVIEHLARHGFVVATPGDPKRPGGVYDIYVLRNAAHRAVRNLFGKLIGTIAPEDARPQVVSKGNGRQVVVMGALPAPPGGTSAGDWAWWVEGDDLVVVTRDSNAADEVIAVLDGQKPSAVDQSLRNDLLAAEGGFQPAAIGVVNLDQPDASPTARQLVEQGGIHRITFQWGFEDKALKTVVQIDAPAPRKGVMSLFDQPTFSPDDVPPMPPDVEHFAVVSIEPERVVDQIARLLDQAMPGMGSQLLQSIEATVQESIRLDLREEILGPLGPKMAFYTIPTPEPAAAADDEEDGGANGNGPLGGLLSGFQLPAIVIAIEVSDPDSYVNTFDALIVAANRQLETAFAVPAPPGEEGDEEEVETPDVPRLEMLTTTPRIYMLKLPEGLVALTGLQPTIALGKGYLFITSTPLASRQARDLESAEPADRWSPQGEVAQALSQAPAEVLMLAVDDPSRTLPQAIVTLPTTVQAGLEFLASIAPETEEPEEAPAGGGPGGRPGGRPGGGQEPAVGTIAIAPELIPSTDAIRSYPFPASYIVSVDDQGVRIEGREAFPNLSIVTALSRVLPAGASFVPGGAGPLGGMFGGGGGPAINEPPGGAGASENGQSSSGLLRRPMP